MKSKNNWKFRDFLKEAVEDDKKGPKTARAAKPANKAPTKTATKSNLDDLFSASPSTAFTARTDQPIATRPNQGQQQNKQGSVSASVDVRKASVASSRTAMQNIRASYQAAQLLSGMRNINVPDIEDPGYPVDDPTTEVSLYVNTANLPATIGRDMQAAGFQDPEFHQVARLPGNMSRAIRQLGKHVFSTLTKTRTEDIYMIANLGGSGPNTNDELKAVLGYLVAKGDEIVDADMDFNASIPGYNAQTKLYRAGGAEWLVVKDFTGDYIYSWPEEDSISQWKKPVGQDVPRLK